MIIFSTATIGVLSTSAFSSGGFFKLEKPTNATTPIAKMAIGIIICFLRATVLSLI